MHSWSSGLLVISEKVVAPKRTGSLEGITLRHSTNDDGDLDPEGLDHHTESVAAVLDAESQTHTSYRDGSGCTEKVRCRGALGLPAFRQSLAHRNLISNCCVLLLSTIKRR